MPNGSRFVLPYAAWFDGSGLPLAGGKLSFYESGTSTPLDTYADQLLTTPNPNPVVADADGRWSNIFLAEGPYKVVLSTAADVTLWTADPVTASPGIVSSSLVKATGTPDFRSLEERFRDIADVRDWGVKFDGVTDDTAAWNALIAQINAGVVKHVTLPAGTSRISSTLTPITGSDWWIKGAAYSGSRILMTGSAGSAGTFLQIGDASTRANDWAISNLGLQNLNTASLNGVGNPFDLRNTAAGFIDNVALFSTNGCVTLGSTADGTNSNQIKISRIRMRAHAPAGGTMVDVQSAAGYNFYFCDFGASGTAAVGFKGLHVHPAAGDVSDAGRYTNCIWNYPGPNPSENIVIDATAEGISSQQFIGCVMDQAVNGNNIKVLIGVGAAPNTFINSLTFVGCFTNGSVGTTPVLVDNTGGKPLSLTWTAGAISTFALVGAVRLAGGNRIDLKLADTQFLSRSVGGNPGAAVRVADGVSGVQITGCSVFTRTNDTGGGEPFVPYTHLVNFEGNASDCIITGNDALICTGGLAVTGNISPANAPTILLKDNISAFGAETVARVATTDATVTTLAELPLLDNRVYHVQAIAVAARATGTERASYQLAATFYRTGGGGATLLGAVTVLHSAETDATWDATLDASGNNVRLRVTGEAAATVRWSGEITHVVRPQLML